MNLRWPWARGIEQRADSSYTDALVASITANAGGEVTAYPTATGALEACASFCGRGFASAEVKAAENIQAVLDPTTLNMIGRALIVRGELVLMISTTGGRLKLLPAASHDVDGDGDPSSWAYRLTIGGPERTHTYESVPSTGVLHFRYSVSPETPWRGSGPLQIAQLAGRLSAGTAAALADESSGPRGSFLSVPVDGADPTVELMKADVRRSKGAMLFAQGGDWDAGSSGGPAYWTARRFGADPPAGLVELMRVASMEVYAACGLSGALWSEQDGTAKREGYRQALHSVIAPLGRMVAHECAVKLESPVVLDWVELRAGDVVGRARAFQSMTAAGMDIAKAAALSGLMLDE